MEGLSPGSPSFLSSCSGMVSPSDSYTIQKSSVRRFFAFLSVILVLLALAVAVYIVVRTVQTKVVVSQNGTVVSQGPDSLASAINSSEYQAVFLTNGQVYFGKLSAPGGDYYYLRHIYYLASQAPLQSGRPPSQRLIKLGNELHGPEDLMVINRGQILFVENLKPSGQVSRAIQSATAP